MKWVLVYIMIQPFVAGDVNSLEPYAINPMGPRVTFDSMIECFEARERLSDKVGLGGGYYGPNQQALCIKINPTT